MVIKQLALTRINNVSLRDNLKFIMIEYEKRRPPLSQKSRAMCIA